MWLSRRRLTIWTQNTDNCLTSRVNPCRRPSPAHRNKVLLRDRSGAGGNLHSRMINIVRPSFRSESFLPSRRKGHVPRRRRLLSRSNRHLRVGRGSPIDVRLDHVVCKHSAGMLVTCSIRLPLLCCIVYILVRGRPVPGGAAGTANRNNRDLE